MKTKFILLACFMQYFCSEVFSQLTIDLSDIKYSTESIDISGLKSVLIIRNLLPNQSKNTYSYTIDYTEEAIPAFEIGKFAGNECTETSENLKYVEARKNLLAANDEKSVPNLVKSLQKEINDLSGKFNDCKNEGDAIISSTIYAHDLKFSLRNNQTITLTVYRINKNGNSNDTISWVKVFKTPQKSPWKVLYGFTFVPNKLSKVDNYFAKATDSTNQSFTITKMNDRNNKFWENLSPTIMFQWAPLSKYSFLSNKAGNFIKGLFSNNFYQIGFVGGLSLNFAKETGVASVMAGPSIVIADNLSISSGLTFIQKNVLMGQYKEGDIVKEKLDFGQLHEKKYMLEYFISIAFRFDKNPFSGKDNAK
jgi:hypothetical protein